MTEEQFGPATATDQTADGIGWFAIVDYGHRQEGLQDGTGSFLTFQSKNAVGEWGDWTLINGGLISREPGNEQGDLDLIITVDGKPGGFAIAGDMTKFNGPAAGLIPIVNGQMNIGSPAQRVNTVFVQMLAMETVGKQIQVNGVWQWIDCIPVQTQQGIRWIPTFSGAGE